MTEVEELRKENERLRALLQEVHEFLEPPRPRLTIEDLKYKVRTALTG